MKTMTKHKWMAALAVCVGLGLGGGAFAQPIDPACRQANNQAATNDTIVGGLAGALLGTAVAGKHQKVEGAAVGGLGGALLGNVIGQSNAQPCPPGYYRPPPPPPPYQPQAYRPLPPPPPPAYRPPPPPPGDFWYGAPEGVHDRIEYLQRQVNQANRDGFLSPRELRRLNDRTEGLRRQEADALYRNGGVLYDDDLRGLYHRLSDVSRRLEHDLHDDY
jgi:hypothetical protein